MMVVWYVGTAQKDGLKELYREVEKKYRHWFYTVSGLFSQYSTRGKTVSYHCTSGTSLTLLQLPPSEMDIIISGVQLSELGAMIVEQGKCKAVGRMLQARG